MDLGLSGLASGFDWRSLIAQLMQVERLPEQQLRNQQSAIQQQLTAYQSIQTQMGVLQNSITTLNDPTLFGARTATPADATVASATAAPSTAAGAYNLSVTQMATSAVQQGTSGIAAPLNSSSNVSGLVVTTAPFAAPVTAGTFTVNGATVTIGASDTLGTVFSNISAATSGQVTASYDPTADKITLSSASAIVLGSSTDTSNFLQEAQLFNNGTGTVTSAAKLGAINATAALASGNFATAVSDGGAGQGAFTINGVTINFSATADSLQDVINRINASTAGLTASYDAINRRVLLTNNTTGDLGISVKDVTGNFLAATGLSSGTLVRGNNLLYSINSGPTLTSQSNTITSATSGITGLSITALKNGSTSIQVGSDTTKVTTAINSFISAYNSLQTMIQTDTASTTDASGNVTAGTLAGQSEANEYAEKLRNLADQTITGLSGTISRIQDLGIDSNGNDNTLAITNQTTLSNALANNLSAVQQFFTNTTNGFAVQFNNYLNDVVGTSGTLLTKENDLTQQSSDIDTQVANLERVVTADQESLTNEFLAMEQAEQQAKQQQQFLTQRFGTTG